MAKTISTNQASLIFCIFSVGLKLSALPSLMYGFAGNDSYVACLIALAFDFVGAIIIINIMHKHPDLTFHQLISRKFGKVITKIIQTILFLYFFAKCVLVIQELHDYFIATLFEELNPLFFLIVLSLIVYYASTKNFRVIGRVAELIFWPTLCAILFTLIFPIEDIRLEKLLPIFEQGGHPIYMGVSRTTFAFGDYMILLPLMGQVSLNQKSKKKLSLYALAVFLFVFAFFVIFVGSFGKFATSQTLALGELPLHNSAPATIGKLEWLTIIIWTVILLADALILTIAGRTSFDNMFNVYDKKWTCYVFFGGVTLAVLVTFMQLQTIIYIATTPIFSGASGIFQLILVAMVIIASLGNNNKKKLKIKHHSQKRKKTQGSEVC